MTLKTKSTHQSSARPEQTRTTPLSQLLPKQKYSSKKKTRKPNGGERPGNVMPKDFCFCNSGGFLYFLCVLYVSNHCVIITATSANRWFCPKIQTARSQRVSLGTVLCHFSRHQNPQLRASHKIQSEVVVVTLKYRDKT